MDPKEETTSEIKERISAITAYLKDLMEQKKGVMEFRGRGSRNHLVNLSQVGILSIYPGRGGRTIYVQIDFPGAYEDKAYDCADLVMMTPEAKKQ